MKLAIAIAALVIVLSSVPLFAQQGSAGAQAGASAGGGGIAASPSASASASGSAQANSSAQFEPVNCELVSKLDSKSAKAGDSVVVKTREKVRTAEGTVIPKGSRLVGHLTDVQTRREGHADSRMTIAFDRAELKGGQSLAIHSVIESIAPPVSMASAASMDTDEAMGGQVGGGMAEASRPMGGNRNQGGLGGTVGTATSNAAGVGPNVGATPDRTLPSTAAAVNSTEGLAAETQATAGNGLQGAVESGTGALAMRGSAVPGVALAGDATGTTSGTLWAPSKNVRLDSGTQMVLGVAVASPAR